MIDDGWWLIGYIGLALSLAAELETFGIGVTCIEPGFHHTDLVQVRTISFSSSSFQSLPHFSNPTNRYRYQRLDDHTKV